VNIDDQGMAGLEYKYNESVKGDSGRIVMMTDARGRRFQTVRQAPAPGANLITTIDENIQYIIEKELQREWRVPAPRECSIVAMDPRSGEILGMANYPTFNPNEYTRYSPTNWINRALSTLRTRIDVQNCHGRRGALEEKLTTPDEVIDCQMGSIIPIWAPDS